MTSPAELVHYLDTLGISLWVEGGTLKFRAPAGALSAELAERLRAEKPALIAYLSQPAVPAAPVAVTVAPAAPMSAELTLVIELLGQLLQVDSAEIGAHESLGELGVDSIHAVDLIDRLNQRLGLELQATILFETPTPALLAERLARLTGAPAAATAAVPAVVEEALCQGLLLQTAPGELDFADLAIPAPNAGEVRVRVYASGVNFADLLCVKGLYPTPPQPPYIPGFELAGIVDALGEGVRAFRIGEPVFGVTGAALGGHAQFATLDQRLLVHMLPHWSFAEAAAVPVAFLSAIVALEETARLKAGQTVLIHAAAGGVGFAAVQLASWRGAAVIGSSATPHKRTWLAEAGIAVVDYSQPDFAAEVLALTEGRGVDVVIDTVAGPALQASLDLLTENGVYIQLAVAGQRATPPVALDRFHQNQSFHALDLRRRALADPDWLAAALRRLRALLAEADLRPVFSAVPADQALEALAALERREIIGKLVLTWPQPDELAILEPPRAEAQPVTAPTPAAPHTAVDEPIAIIGISGHLPGSPDLAALWDNLAAGRDLIQEIPPNRWDWRAWYGSSDEGARTEAKWGGFLADIDAFDADFFGISRPEAELMDPRQRLFIQHVWSAFEDAGYDPAQFQGSDTGVFVGVGATDYFERLRPDQIEAHTTTGCFLSIMANRISYMFDLHGPSEPVDTACSSSLVAVHNAVQALRQGACALAIAGSTHLLLSPKIQLALSKSGMMSPDGRCKTFDSRADGYVRGEGVGALLLRPLSAAEAAGDPIHGLILAAAVNHGGRANSLTAPNPNAQAELLIEAYRRAGVDPETVSFIETHGTGTALGDPVEINALKRAFAQLYRDWHKPVPKQAHIALGAVKSNLGHLEISAGLAGIFKLLLAMRHGRRPANVHLRELNPLIDLAGTPFRILRQTETWPRQDHPYRAGVSSFGFGGVNAHVVLEEYRDHRASAPATPAPQLLVLSAKTESALRAYAQRLADHLRAQPQLDPARLAYTLQCGRQPMRQRLAFSFSRLEQAVRNLELVASGQPAPPVTDTHLAPLAQSFLAGQNPDWRQLYPEPLQRLALPTYPFARDRYWLIEQPALPEPVSAAPTALGPALDTNISDLAGLKFAKRWERDDFVLADHVVGPDHVLPGVAYVEMAIAAGDRAGLGPVRGVADVVWARPLVYTDRPIDCEVHLAREQGEVVARVLAAGQIHAEMRLQFEDQPRPAALDLAAIAARCPNRLDAAAFYRRLATMNLNYRHAFQAVRTVHYSADELVAELVLPASLEREFSAFRLHPSLADGALQTVCCFLTETQLAAGVTFLPFSLDAVRCHAPLTRELRVYAKPSGTAMPSTSVVEHQLDVFVCDSHGQVLLSFEGFATKLLNAPQPQQAPAPAAELGAPLNDRLHLFAPSFASATPGPACDPGTLLLLARDGQIHQRLAERWPTAVLASPGGRLVRQDRNHWHYAPGEEGLAALFAQLDRDGRAPATLVHLGHQLEPKQALLEWFAIGKALSDGDRQPPRLLATLDAAPEARPLAQALFALLRTLAQESHSEVRLLATGPANLATALTRELGQRWSGPALIVDAASGPTRFALTPVPPAPVGTPTGLRQGCIALVTGGNGAIAATLASFLVQRLGAKVALVGRSVAGSRTQALLAAHPGKIRYCQADVANLDQMTAVREAVETEWGGLQAVFHCAGTTRDGLLYGKSRADFEAVLAPKLQGCQVLDQVTAASPLDCFVLFSSIAGAMGNAGQCDYAAANGFLDGFAARRAERVREGQRRGHSLSINWPFWLEGGIQLRPEHLAAIAERTGLAPLDNATALDALLMALAHGSPQILASPGKADVIATYLQGAAAPSPAQAVAATPVAQPAPAAAATRPTYLTDLFADVLKKPKELLESHMPFQDFGVDSFLTLKVIKTLEKDFGKLPKTLLFENHNLGELDQWLSHHHPDTYARLNPASSAPLAPSADPAPIAPSPTALAPAAAGHLGLLREKLAEVLKKDIESLAQDQPFQDYGIDSFLTLKVIKSLEKDFGKLPKTLLFENHNLRQLASWFDTKYGAPAAEPAPAAPAATAPPEPEPAPVAPPPSAAAPARPDLVAELRQTVAQILKKQPGDLDPEAPFQDFGVDSFLTLKIIKQLEKNYGQLPKTLLFENHNLRQLGQWLEKNTRPQTPAVATVTALEQARDLVGQLLKKPPLDLALDLPFQDMGVDSLMSLKIIKSLEKIFGPLPKTLLFENHTLGQLGAWLETHGRPPGRDLDRAKLSPRERVSRAVADVLKRSPDSLDPVAPFHELGVDSFQTLKIIKELERSFGPLPKTLLFENHTIEQLSHWLTGHGGSALAHPVVAAEHLPSALPDREGQPLITAVADLERQPALLEHIERLVREHGREGSISRGTPDIAPYLFIDPAYRCYFNFTVHDGVVLAYAYTGPDELQDPLILAFLAYCRKHELQLNLFEEKRLERVGNEPFTATPFGVMQRVLDIPNFTLAGNKMRRLRYLVQKFEQLGACHTEHYLPGSDPSKDAAMAAVIEAWCAQKTQVNPLIYKVRDELLAGVLHPRHRIYLTWLDDTLCNAILVTRLRQGETWLMDLEFYGPDMPLGGLEYAIVHIIQHLASEGMQVYSLGGTYGPLHEASPNEDEGVRALLDEMRERDDFGKGNVQFKNKFRTENGNIFLCRPAGADPGTVMDLLMMIADPISMRERPPELTELGHAQGKSQSPEASSSQLQSRSNQVGNEVAERGKILAAAAYNPHRLTPDQVRHDLQTDSWAQLNHTGLRARIANLERQPEPAERAEQALARLLGKRHVVLARSGRDAEALLMGHWPIRKGVVPQNLLFPSGLFHQFDQGFSPHEFPVAQVFEREARTPWKGELDLYALRAFLADQRAETAFVCVELCDNAAGGGGVRLEHLRALRQVLQPAALPLLLDATRILENALLVQRAEADCAQLPLWTLVRQLTAQADVVVGSLAKDFSIHHGGFVATDDSALHTALSAALDDIAHELALADSGLLARALADPNGIEQAVTRRMAQAARLHALLQALKVPVAQPGGAHCVLIDPATYPGAAHLPHPDVSLTATLFQHTGIRMGSHSAGMQRDTPLNGLVRLAVPVGLDDAEFDEIAARLHDFFTRWPPLLPLTRESGQGAVFGSAIDAPYRLS